MYIYILAGIVEIITYAIICKIARQVSTYTKQAPASVYARSRRDSWAVCQIACVKCKANRPTYIRLITYLLRHTYVCMHTYVSIECSLTTTVDRHHHYHPTLSSSSSPSLSSSSSSLCIIAVINIRTEPLRSISVLHPHF